MSEIQANKISPATGTGLTLGDSGDTLTLTAGANLTLGGSSSTITIPSGATITNNGTQTGFGGSTDVAFHAQLSTGRTLSHEVWTLLHMNSEIIDIGSCYDASNYKFTVPSGKGGTYHVGYQVTVENASNTKQYIAWGKIYKNGSNMGDVYSHYQNNTDNPSRNVTVSSSFIVNLSASDYLEMYAMSATNNSSNSTAVANYTTWWGYKLVT